MEKQRIINHLTISVGKYRKRFKYAGKLAHSQFQAEIFKAIINHMQRLHKNEPWFLSDGGVQEITEDFNLLHDFHFGSQKKGLNRFLRTYAELFLSDTEAEDFKKLGGQEDEKLTWLQQTAEPKLRPLWHFLVSLCRSFKQRTIN